LNKLPNIATTVYRAISRRVISDPKSQYKNAAQLVWVAFSSTSKNMDQLSNFAKDDQGTWIIMTITEGKDISSFSMFQNEEEVLLLPNTYLKVESILTENMKAVMKINKPHLDVIELKQIPTPRRFKTLTIVEY